MTTHLEYYVFSLFEEYGLGVANFVQEEIDLLNNFVFIILHPHAPILEVITVANDDIVISIYFPFGYTTQAVLGF